MPISLRTGTLEGRMPSPHKLPCWVPTNLPSTNAYSEMFVRSANFHPKPLPQYYIWPLEGVLKLLSLTREFPGVEARGVWEVWVPGVFSSLCRLLMGQKRKGVVVPTLAKLCCLQSSASVTSTCIISPLLPYCQNVFCTPSPLSLLHISRALLVSFTFLQRFYPRHSFPLRCKTDNDNNHHSRMSPM